MNSGFEFVPTAAGLSFAAAAVAIGAPLFSDGLRAIRLARAFRALEPSSIADAASGLAHVHGQVTLESPMFSPLGGIACAGYRLELSGGERRIARAIESFRAFRIVDGDQVARVVPEDARYDLAVAARREVRADQPLSENLEILLERTPEARWLRRSGGTLTLTERVLAAGADCHVVGHLRHSRAPQAAIEVERLRTGTDDADVPVVGISAATVEPEHWIGAGEHLRFLLVSDRAPDRAHFRISRLRQAGAFAGPALSLGGLLYFAQAADHLRSLGRF